MIRKFLKVFISILFIIIFVEGKISNMFVKTLKGTKIVGTLGTSVNVGE